MWRRRATRLTSRLDIEGRTIMMLQWLNFEFCTQSLVIKILSVLSILLIQDILWEVNASSPVRFFLCAVCRSGRSEKTTCCLQSCGSCGVHSHVCWLYPDMGIIDKTNDSSFLDNDTLANSALSWSSLAQHNKPCNSFPHLPNASGWRRRWEHFKQLMKTS